MCSVAITSNRTERVISQLASSQRNPASRFAHQTTPTTSHRITALSNRYFGLGAPQAVVVSLPALFSLTVRKISGDHCPEQTPTPLFKYFACSKKRNAMPTRDRKPRIQLCKARNRPQKTPQGKWHKTDSISDVIRNGSPSLWRCNTCEENSKMPKSAKTKASPIRSPYGRPHQKAYPPKIVETSPRCRRHRTPPQAGPNNVRQTQHSISFICTSFPFARCVLPL